MDLMKRHVNLQARRGLQGERGYSLGEKSTSCETKNLRLCFFFKHLGDALIVDKQFEELKRYQKGQGER